MQAKQYSLLFAGDPCEMRQGLLKRGLTGAGRNAAVGVVVRRVVSVWSPRYMSDVVGCRTDFFLLIVIPRRCMASSMSGTGILLMLKKSQSSKYATIVVWNLR